MANWTGTARSNYFRVKDPDAFEAWVEMIGCEVIADMHGRLGFLPGDMSDGGFPSTYDDEETGETFDIDIEADIVQFLAEGEIAVLQEIGSEGCRYLTGYSVAIAWDGRTTRVHIDDIYSKAGAEFGKRPANATY